MLHGIRLGFSIRQPTASRLLPLSHSLHPHTFRSVCCHYLTRCIFRLKCAAVICFSFFLALLNISFANRNILLACRYIIFNRFIHLDFGFQIHFEFEIFCILKKEQKIKRKNNNTAATTYTNIRFSMVQRKCEPSKCFYNKQNKTKQKNEAKTKNPSEKKISKIHCTSTESENQ